MLGGENMARDGMRGDGTLLANPTTVIDGQRYGYYTIAIIRLLLLACLIFLIPGYMLHINLF